MTGSFRLPGIFLSKKFLSRDFSGQYHFFLELHHANARLKDDQIEIVVGSQALDKVQRAIAHVLNLRDAQVPKFYLKNFFIPNLGHSQMP